MAVDEEDNRPAGEKLERGAARTILNWIVVLAAFAVIGLWIADRGWVRLEPGDAAVILRVGKLNRTISEPGLKLIFPAPIEYATVVSVRQVRHLEFGVRPGTEDPERGVGGIAMQTSDSNIVMLGYELQYEVGSAYSFLFEMANPEATLSDATQAAVREVVGRKTLSEVLSEDRRGIESEAKQILQQTLDGYFAERGHGTAFHIRAIELQSVQHPEQVAQAFAEVNSAKQDEVRSVSVARGDEQEILESANAKAQEYREIALGYRESKVLEAQGAASRFSALLKEYRLAPEVTRNRLYIETMESVLPGVEKMIVEPDTVNMIPFMPMRGGAMYGPSHSELPAVSAPPKEQSTHSSSSSDSSDSSDSSRFSTSSRSSTSSGREDGS